MAWIVITAALFCLTVKGYSGKRTSAYVERAGDAFLFNCARMALCLAIGLILVLFEGAGRQLRIDGKMLAVCALAGISSAVSVAAWMLAVRKNSMVMLDVTVTAGSILPAVLCALIFAEAISVHKLLGFVLVVIAAGVLAGYSKQAVGKPGVAGLMWLFLYALGDGLNSFAQQLYKQLCSAEGAFTAGGPIYPKSVFHFYTYGFALLFLLLVYALRRPRGQMTRPAAIRKALPHIGVMAVCLFAANYFQTVAANDYAVPSQILYPVIKGGSLITVNVTAMLFFGEKPTWRSICGTGLALAGIVLMNVL